MTHRKAILITCFVALMWSLAGLNIKMIQWSGFAIAGGRSLIAVLLLSPMVLRGSHIRIDPYVAGGAICYAAFNYCFIISTKLTTSANAIMLQYTAPIYVALLSWVFLKERITKADIFSMLFVFIGMVLFFADEAGGGTTAGNVIAIFNGITFAGISIFLRLQKDEDPVISMYFGNVISAVIGLPFMVLAGKLDKNSLLFLLIAGCLVALTYTLYAKASKELSALEIVLLPIIDPVMNPIWVFLTLNERPGRLSLAGAVIVLITVTTRILWGIKKSPADL